MTLFEATGIERPADAGADADEGIQPEGWAIAGPLDVADLIRGVSYKKGEALSAPKDSHVALLRANNIAGELVFKELQYVPAARVSADQVLRAGDVVVAMSSGSKSVVGKTAQLLEDWKGTFGAFCGVLRPSPLIDAAFFGHYFQTRQYRDTISEASAGTNINNLGRHHFATLRFPLPPLAEQKRIAAKVEAVLAKANAARQRLAKVPAILKRFRQSVLAAACSGRLTEDWREATEADLADVHPLKRITFLRQEHDGRNARMVPELSAAAVSELPDLPARWAWARFGDVIGELRNGIATRPNMSPPGTPILRINAARPGKVLLETERYLPATAELVEQYRIADGDLLFTRYNGSLDLLGVCGMVRQLKGRIMLYPDKLMRVRFDHDQVLPEYAETFFQTPEARDRMTDKAKSSAGQQGISGSDVKGQPIAIPPLPEQHEIVRRVSALFALADKVEARLAAATAAVERVTRAVLAKAFRGELVETEAALARREGRDYEPAAALLERVTAARAADAPADKPKRRRGSAKSKA